MSSQPLTLSLSLQPQPSSHSHLHTTNPTPLIDFLRRRLRHHHHRRLQLCRERPIGPIFAGPDDSPGSVAVDEDEDEDDFDSEPEPEPTADDLEYISQIKRVLELLKRNRDMLFGEVKLTIMIEDPREVERRRLLGIDDLDAPTRDDLVTALEEVNEGRVPRNRVALRMLAEEMTNWPNLEAEPPKKSKGGSLYARATDTGIDPKVAAKKLNIDWDSAAEIQEEDTKDDTEVPPVVG